MRQLSKQLSLVLAAVLLSGLVAGCAAQTPTPNEATEPAEAAASEDTFTNPVFRADFPDPHIILVDGTYYAYATNGSSKNVQVSTSTDLIHWERTVDAMPSIASWAQLGGSYIWAPEVMQIGDQFVLYYTARDREADKQCVGVAVADKPEGKFRDENDEPLVCQVEEGGTIDAHPFRDEDGTLYLYYKNDGNCCGKGTFIYVQEMSEDGLSLVGEPVQLVRNDKLWEGRVIEAPTMWVHEGSYYLFYSANDYGSHEYAVGYALCETAMGPCEDAEENPILSSKMDEPPLVIGPGHQTIIVDDDGETWMVYHVWEIVGGSRGSRRFMWIDPLIWVDGKPVVHGPSTEPQPLP